MEATLDPAIHDKLLDFQRRWRNLILFRGLCFTVLMLCGGLLLLTIADWGLVLEQNVREWCAIVLYSLTVLVFLLECIRPLSRLPNLRGIAALMEKAEPTMRNDLLAAVELGDVKNEGEAGSQVFREMLQRDVAQRVEKLNVSHSLHTGLIQKWLVAGCMLLTAIILTALIPSTRGQLLRATLPWWVNIGTAASTRIVLIQPVDPEKAFAPKGETLPVVVEIQGLDLQGTNPTLETDDGQGNIESLTMNASDENNASTQFKSSVEMKADQIKFRIVVGKENTQWYTARAVEPPRVMGFIKKVTNPEYPLFPAFKPQSLILEEESGDLALLAGSKVDLQAVMNQQVKSATMKLFIAGNATDYPMKLIEGNEPTGRTASFLVNTNSAYTIHLIDELGLTNRSPTKFSVRIEPDLEPDIALLKPNGNIISSPEDVLGMEAIATDDVAIGEVRRLTRVIKKDANTTWTTNVLAVPTLPGNNATINQPLDLLPLDVKPGDQVLTRLMAIDVLGQTNTTATLSITIRSLVFEVARGEALLPKRVVYDTVHELREITEKLRAAVPMDLTKRARDSALGDLRKTADEVDDLVPNMSDKLNQADTAIRSALGRARGGRESAELVVFGRAVHMMDHDLLAALRVHMPELAGAIEAVREDRAKAAAKAVASMHQLAKKLETAVRANLAADEAAVLLDHLDFLSRAQSLMNRVAEADAPKDVDAWKRLARRQSGALKELEAIKTVVAESADHFSDPIFTDLNATIADLEAIEVSVKLALKQDVPGPDLLKPAKLLQAAIKDAASSIRPLARNMADDSSLARDELEDGIGNTHDALSNLRTVLSAQKKTRDDQNGKQADALRDALARVALAEGNVNHAWETVNELLNGRVALEGARPDSDHIFLRDLINAARAVKTLKRSPKSEPELSAAIANIANALDTLEQAHLLVDLEASIKLLAQHEQWEKAATDINTLRVREWDWQREIFRRLPKALRNAKLADATADLIDQAAGSDGAKAVSLEMNRRKTEPGVFGVEEQPK